MINNMFTSVLMINNMYMSFLMNNYMSTSVLSVTSLSIPYNEIINMYNKTTVLYHVTKTFFSVVY